MKNEFRRELDSMEERARELTRDGKSDDAAFVRQAIEKATEAISEMEERLNGEPDYPANINDPGSPV